MIMSKKWMATLLAAALIVGATGCGSSGDTNSSTTAATETTTAVSGTTAAEQESTDSSGVDYDSLTLSLGYSSAVGTVNDVCMNYVADLLKEQSGGQVILDLYPSSQLGNDKELLTECAGGNVPLISMSTSAIVSVVPELALFDLPCAFQDVQVVRAAINEEEYFNRISDWFETKGMKLLLINPIGFRYMTSNSAVESFADFKGVNIRTMENKNHMDFWSALGANPTPIAANEVYLSLQQGLVEAQEGALTGIINSKYYEQQKYLIKTSHLAQIFAVAISKATWDSMSPETQELFEKCFAETHGYMSAYSDEAEGKDIESLKAEGMEYIELGEDVFQQMQEAGQGVYQNISSAIGQDVVDEYLAKLNQ